MAQTTVQHRNSIRFGSGKMEIGTSEQNLVDVGAITEGVFEEAFDAVRIASDNAGTVYEGIANHTATFTANLMEIRLETLAQYLRGVAKVSTVPGTPGPQSNEPHTLVGTSFIRLNVRDATGAVATAMSVKYGSGFSSTASEGTDYVVATDVDGYTCIARTTESTIPDNSVVQVTYTVTPAVRKILNVGGNQRLDASVVRFTNYNSERKKFEITVWKATAATGINIEFQADDADETNVCPIELTGTPDTSRAIDSQLFTIVDEQDVE